MGYPNFQQQPAPTSYAPIYQQPPPQNLNGFHFPPLNHAPQPPQGLYPRQGIPPQGIPPQGIPPPLATSQSLHRPEGPIVTSQPLYRPEAFSRTPNRYPRPRPPSNLWKPIVINTNNNSSPAFDSSTSNSEISPESPADVEVQDIVELETKQEDNNMSPASVHMGVANGHTTASGLTAATGPTTNEDCGIREVWAHNLDEEFKTICQIIQKFPFVAMDTEFPGVVARPIGEFKSTADYQYQLLRCNVDLLKIIQLGLTFLDETGSLPDSGPSTWQFNFKFNLTEDMYAEDSVDLLQNSGIQFEKHEQEGIDPMHFAEMMLVSGLVLMDNVKWLSFHSGYDFGYLLNLLTNQNLPKTEGEFFGLLKLYFPNVYDVKYLMKSCKNLKGGLQEVANELEVRRVGPQHQAGSDALLTGQTFFRMKEMFFEDDIDDSKYCGHLFGLGTSYVVSPPNTNQSPPVSTAAAPASSTNTTTSTTPASSSATASSTTSSIPAPSTVASTSSAATSNNETTSSSLPESSAATSTTPVNSSLAASSSESNPTTGGMSLGAISSSTNIGVTSTTETGDLPNLNNGDELTSSSDLLSQDSSSNNVESSSA